LTLFHKYNIIFIRFFNVKKWAKNYKNIIEKQKAEIARISEAFGKFQEKYHKK